MVAGIMQHTTYAQSAGSQESVSGYMAIAAGGTHASAGESLYIGPGTYIINGTWQVYSKNIWISPDAVISGSGIVHFYNPSAAGGTASPTLMDGNNSNNFINANLALHNAADMVLTDHAMTAAMTTAGWADAGGNASLSVGADFNFAVANGDMLTGNHDMTLNSNGTLSNYQENRFVVTAGSGHLVKQNYTGAFIFPVGMAAGDYTPAQITNAIANTFHVNVTNYTGVTNATFAGAIVAGPDGVNRGWNIYADNAAGNSTMNLEHNDSTEGYVYSDPACFVTRLIGTSPNTAGDNTSYSYWESNNQAAGTGTGTLTTGAVIATASERSRAYTTFATSAAAYSAWYTKASNLLYPLPVSLVSFTGSAGHCGTTNLTWKTTQEEQVPGYEIQQSTNGMVFTAAGTITAQNLPGTNTYNFRVAQNNGVSYYRLKIKARDGSYHYSTVIAVKMDCNSASTRLYPQPFSDALTIITSGGELKSLQVFDMAGRVVKAVYTANGNTIQLDGARLAPGAYVLRLCREDGTIEYTKAVKQ
jgi:hypothetical protein